MFAFLPLLLGSRFYGLTVRLPKPATAVCLVDAANSSYAFTGDAEGEVRRIWKSIVPAPICVRPGRIVALEATSSDDLALAYVPATGAGIIEAWKAADEGATLVRTVRTFPRESRPIVVDAEDGAYAVVLPGEARVSLLPAKGDSREVAFSRPVVDLTVARHDGGIALVAALTDGTIESRDTVGTALWRTKVAPEGTLTGLTYKPRASGSTAAWTSNEDGGRIGLVDVGTGDSVGVPVETPGVVKGYMMSFDTLLVATENQMWGPRRIASWSAPSPIVAMDATGMAEAAALADGTFTIRLPLWHWMRTGDEHPIPSKPPR